MRQGRLHKRSFSVILAEAVILAEIRRIQGLKEAQFLACDIRADSIDPLNHVCGPSLSVLGVAEYGPHLVTRYICLNGQVGVPTAVREDLRLFKFSASCTLFSAKSGGRLWRPFMSYLTVNALRPAQEVISHFECDTWLMYTDGRYDDVPVTKNADNPCEALCALQTLVRQTVKEEEDDLA